MLSKISSFPGRLPPNDISFTNKRCVLVSVYRSVHSLNRPARPQMICCCSYGKNVMCSSICKNPYQIVPENTRQKCVLIQAWHQNERTYTSYGATLILREHAYVIPP